jgi:acetyl-CoA carboxylase biotin carboxyl carrier protein
MEKIKKIMELFQNSNLSEMELELEEFKIKMSKNTQVQVIEVNSDKNISNNVQQVNQEIKEENNHQLIKSKLVGTYYASNVQGGQPLVKIGDVVKQGQIVAVIEAMKVMNQIKSPFSGIVKKINFENDQMVQFDDVMMEIQND